MAVQVSNRAPQHLISNPLPLRLRRGQELTFNTDIGTPDDRGTHVLGINRQSLGFPPGFGGWSVRSSYHVTPTEETSGELREKLTRVSSSCSKWNACSLWSGLEGMPYNLQTGQGEPIWNWYSTQSTTGLQVGLQACGFVNALLSARNSKMYKCLSVIAVRL